MKKLEGESKKEDEDLMKPVGIRRTQSTKILDLAANLFQPSESIELTKKPAVERSDRTPPSRPSGGGNGGRKLPSRSQTCKMASPSAIQRRQSSDSFIRELLEMAKVEVNLGDEKPKKVNDFKSQICQASTKIARRKTFKESDNIEKPVTCLRSKSTHTPANVTTSPNQSANNKVEELDPFVKEILNSGLVLDFFPKFFRIFFFLTKNDKILIKSYRIGTLNHYYQSKIVNFSSKTHPICIEITISVDITK